MTQNLIYLISQDAAWAEHLDGLVRDERLGKVSFFPLGKGALAAYRLALPDVVIFDLRHERRDVTVALTMIREIFPRMAQGGVCIIGAADPADREALREERDQLARIHLAEYLPRNVPDDFLIERIHALHQRAEEHKRQSEEAPGMHETQASEATASTHAATPAHRVENQVVTGSKPAHVPAPAPGQPIVCRVKILISNADLQDRLMKELADLGAELLNPEESRSTPDRLPDFLIVDGASAEQHASFITQLRRQFPGLRIIQLPDEGDKSLRRLSRDISALLNPTSTMNEVEQLAGLIRHRVESNGGGDVPILLLVEDEQNIRELTAHYLLLQGYEVYQAEDGQEAMTVFRARQPHMILSDVYMPRMNGFKLLLEVKNWVPDMPMLMMTGYSSAAQVLNTSKYRNVTFLPKPFRLSELGERIRSMLGALR